MNPPPPMLPALGSVTASANAVATAASTALPPLASTAAPASHAGADVQTTSPFFDDTASSGAAFGRAAGSARRTVSASAYACFIRRSLLESLAPGMALACAEPRDADLARSTIPPWRHVRRPGDELLALLGGCQQSRFVSDRCRRDGDAHRAARSHRAVLARLSARHSARPAVRLSRSRAVGPRPGALVQSQQAAAGSIR